VERVALTVLDLGDRPDAVAELVFQFSLRHTGGFADESSEEAELVVAQRLVDSWAEPWKLQPLYARTARARGAQCGRVIPGDACSTRAAANHQATG
jgi:hypothetical protein